MVTVTHISGYSDTFISKFQCEIIILGQFLHLKEVFREVILTGIVLSPIEWLNLNRHTLIINKRPYLNRHTLIIHRKACLFGTWVVTCGYCDTPLTVTLLPFPEGVTVSGHYCISCFPQICKLYSCEVLEELRDYAPLLAVCARAHQSPSIKFRLAFSPIKCSIWHSIFQALVDQWSKWKIVTIQS